MQSYMNRFFTYSVFALVSFCTFAQQDAQVTQYMYNTINVNPAYAGTRGVASVFGLYRAQWVGLEGAPTSIATSVNTPLRNNKMGLGVSFMNDRIGIVNESTLSIDYSYIMKLNSKYKLALGIKSSANLLDVDYSRLNIHDNSDVHFQQNINNRIRPNFGTGAYLFSDNFYAGLSVSNLLKNDFEDAVQGNIDNKRLNFYGIFGFVFDINPYWKFKPAVLTKVVSGAPLQGDVSANFMYNERFVIGAAYRMNAAASAMLGFQITEGLFAGYAYDIETTNLRKFNSGSHEVFLRYELNRTNAGQLISPRFF